MDLGRIRANHRLRRPLLWSAELNSSQLKGGGSSLKASYTTRWMQLAKRLKAWQRTYGSRRCPGPAAKTGPKQAKARTLNASAREDGWRSRRQGHKQAKA